MILSGGKWLTTLVPTGTVRYMATTEKRPRIHPDQAALLDQIRGRVPFEAMVEEAIGMYLHLYVTEEFRRKPRFATDDELMVHLLQTDRFQFDGDQFRKAFDAAMQYHAEEMARQKAEDEEVAALE